MRIEGESGTTPMRFEHVIWRILDDIRGSLANRDSELAIVMVGELEDYALTFSKRRNDIIAARTIEDYTLTKVARFMLQSRVDGKTRESVLKGIQEFFALSVRRPVALAALAPIIAMNTGTMLKSNRRYGHDFPDGPRTFFRERAEGAEEDSGRGEGPQKARGSVPADVQEGHHEGSVCRPPRR